MKKIWLLLVLITLITLLTSLVSAQNNIYRQDSLQVQLNVNGDFTLLPDGNSARVSTASAELLLYPQETKRQSILEEDNWGDVNKGKVVYEWKDKTLGKKDFGYTAIVKTKNWQQRVNKKIPFPIEDISGYEQYTLPTEKIDSNNHKIIAKAQEIVEGENDLFKATFKLANWVSENVDYDLNELTTDVAQPASWVLENKQGVCDEMTSLFVAMARSQGIPARFVSGISYTEHEDVLAVVGSNWASHGWAEIYFPEFGWVSFDITFDEYGYVDVTHIKLREGLDPDEPATKYQWIANNVKLETGNLDLDVDIQKEGNVIPEEIMLEQELLSKETDLESYNLVKGVLRNTADYYVATTLRVAVPEEIEVIGNNRRTLLLSPKETRETFWPIKIKKILNQDYSYTFPILVYSEKNVTVEDSFKSAHGQTHYTKEEIDLLLVKDEEKSYSRKVTLLCDYQRELALNEETEAECTISNNGAKTLSSLRFCVRENCKTINLAPAEDAKTELTLQGEEIGWNKILVTAENDLIEKKSSFPYLVFDKPEIKVTIDAGDDINYGDPVKININLKKTSFSTPKDITVILDGGIFERTWTLETLNFDEELKTELKEIPISGKNKFTVTTMWKDGDGRLFSDEQDVVVKASATGFGEQLTMWWNGFSKLFYI